MSQPFDPSSMTPTERSIFNPIEYTPDQLAAAVTAYRTLQAAKSDQAAEQAARIQAINNTLFPANPGAGNFWSGSQQPQGWEPVAIRKDTAQREFPTDCLPDLVRDAVLEVAEATQAPLPMIAGCALANVSATVQAYVSIRRGVGLEGPAGLYVATVAESGERKTTVDNYFRRGIDEWERTQAEANESKRKEYQARKLAWEAKVAGVTSAIKKHSAETVNSGVLTKLESDMLALQTNEPPEPRLPRILRQDDTQEALAQALVDYPIAAIMSSEAGIVFGAYGMNPDSVMRNLASLNVYWDGGRLQVGRKTVAGADIEGMRVTVNLLFQRAVLDNFMGKNGTLARGIGYFARFLLAVPTSTMGGRFFRELNTSTPALDAFTKRQRQVLNFPVQFDESGKLATTMLDLTPRAKELWIAYHDSIEEELGHGRDLFDVRDVAAKSAENAARIAACLSAFCEGPTAPVSDDHMDSGRQLAEWYVHEALRFFNIVALPQGLKDAEELEGWICGRCKALRVNHIAMRDITLNGPGRLRNKDARKALIEFLVDHNRIHVTRDGQKELVYLHPKVAAEWSR